MARRAPGLRQFNGLKGDRGSNSYPERGDACRMVIQNVQFPKIFSFTERGNYRVGKEVSRMVPGGSTL